MNAPTIDANNLDPSVLTLAKSIRSVESNSNFDAKGKSGETGAYQFLPKTWQSWAGQYLGDPNAKMTPENQNKVAYMKIADLKAQGYKPDQVASIWNSGKPDYQGNVGTNSSGVKFDTPQYVNSVMNKYTQLKGGNQTGATLPNASQVDPNQPQQPDPLAGSVGGFIGNTLGNLFPSLGKLAGGIGSAIIHPIDTISNLGSIAAGGAEKLVGMNTPDTQNFSNVASQLGQRFGITKLAHGDVGGAVKDLLTTVQNDPAGFALDLATALEGGGAIAGKLGESADLSKIANAAKNIPGTTIGSGVIPLGVNSADTIANAGRGASTLSQVGSALSRAGNTIDPLRLAGSAISTITSPVTNAVEKLPGQLMNTVIGTTAKDLATGRNLGEQLVQQGVWGVSDARVYNDIQNRANVLKNIIAEKAASTAGNLDTAEILGQVVKDTLEKYKGAYTQSHIEDAILRNPSLETLLTKPTLTWGEANTLRQGLDQIVGETGHATDTALALQKQLSKSASNRLREVIKQATGTRDEFSKYAPLVQSIKRLGAKLGKNERSALNISLKELGLGGFGFATGGAFGGLGSLAAERALRSTATKTITAQALSKILKGTKALATSKYAKAINSARIPLSQAAKVSQMANSKR